MRQRLWIGADEEQVSRAAAEEFVTVAAEQTSAGRLFAVALSGGRTPRRTYELLASEPWRSRVRWQNVHFFWGDERVVPPTHPDSNYHMAYEALLRPLGIGREQIHRIPAELEEPEQAARCYEQELARFFGCQPSDPPPSFDFAFLGVGSDGHTASLFPGTVALRERQRWVVPNWVPAWNAWRITLTLPIWNAALRIAFVVTGAEKAPVVARILGGSCSLEECPAAAIAPRESLLWFLDEAAASQLSQRHC